MPPRSRFRFRSGAAAGRAAANRPPKGRSGSRKRRRSVRLRAAVRRRVRGRRALPGSVPRGSRPAGASPGTPAARGSTPADRRRRGVPPAGRAGRLGRPGFRLPRKRGGAGGEPLRRTGCRVPGRRGAASPRDGGLRVFPGRRARCRGVRTAPAAPGRRPVSLLREFGRPVRRTAPEPPRTRGNGRNRPPPKSGSRSVPGRSAGLRPSRKGSRTSWRARRPEARRSRRRRTRRARGGPPPRTRPADSSGRGARPAGRPPPGSRNLRSGRPGGRGSRRRPPPDASPDGPPAAPLRGSPRRSAPGLRRRKRPPPARPANRDGAGAAVAAAAPAHQHMPDMPAGTSHSSENRKPGGKGERESGPPPDLLSLSTVRVIPSSPRPAS